MSLVQIISCCPWRLPAERPLTPYEWTVAEKAVASGVADEVRLNPALSGAMARALTTAISQQGCRSWTHTAFGPEPAVATFAYGCLGSWWAALDPASQAKAMTDIRYGNLLCQPNPPWTSCQKAARDKLWRPVSRNEYAPQHGIPSGVATGCIGPRWQIGYAPMTGAEMFEMFKQLGSLPPELMKMVTLAGPIFYQRSFILGWELRRDFNLGNLTGLSSTDVMLRVLDASLEDVALIWKPGQGMSIRQMVVTGKIDPAKVMTLIQYLLPEVFPQVIGTLPQVIQTTIPQILQNLPPFDWGNIFGHISPQQFTGAQSAPVTGLEVVDEPASEQTGTDPRRSPPDKTSLVLPAMAAILGAAVLVWALRRRG